MYAQEGSIVKREKRKNEEKKGKQFCWLVAVLKLLSLSLSIYIYIYMKNGFSSRNFAEAQRTLYTQQKKMRKLCFLPYCLLTCSCHATFL